jgi:2-octaprenyl-6-methoxyphenol hydroxylase
VVGAEGRQSPLRGQAGIGTARHDYGQVGLVGAFAHERSHSNRALELFLPAGPFAQLPMSDSGTRHLGAAARLLLRLDRAAGVASGCWRWTMPASAASCAAASATTWARSSRSAGAGTTRSALHALRYTAPRLALVGDAAHGMHPIAGQGLNIGFRDVAALASWWATPMRSADVGSAALLARYQARAGRTLCYDRRDPTRWKSCSANDIGPVRSRGGWASPRWDRIEPLKRLFAGRRLGCALPG